MRKKVLQLLAGILVLTQVTVSSFGQIGSTEIDLLVEDAMQRFNVAGVAVGVIKDDMIVHSRGYGVKSVETNEEVDEHTAFAIASNSKAFTATALAMLVEEGKLSWQDRVKDHIPEFKMYNDYVTRNFNIQDLLTHRSGLGLGAGDLQIWPTGADFTMTDLLTNFQHFEPVSAFRTKYDYDNILYLVAGEVIARVSGTSWEDFIKERILDPLGMENSSTLPADRTDLVNVSSPHMAFDGELKIIAPYTFDPGKTNGAAAGILSCANDMCKWLLVNLNEGKYGPEDRQQLFTGESQAEMWKIHTTIKTRFSDRYKNHFTGYGLGWRLADMDGKLSISHTGDVSGMLSKTIMIPGLDLGVVVLTNSYYGGAGVFRAVSQTIVDSYLGLEPFDWTGYYFERSGMVADEATEVVRAVWEVVESGKHEDVRIEDYLGTYEDPWFGRVKVHLKEGKPWFTSIRSPRLDGPMFHYKANAFAIRWADRELDADAFAIFNLDEEGRAWQITMKGISPDIDFSYDFQDLRFERIR